MICGFSTVVVTCDSYSCMLTCYIASCIAMLQSHGIYTYSYRQAMKLF